MKKRIALLILILMAALMLGGCGSYANLYITEDQDGLRYEFQLWLKSDELTLLEASAALETSVKKTAYNPFDQSVMPNAEWRAGESWTVREYLRVLSASSAAEDFSYIKTDSQSVAGYEIMVFGKSLPSPAKVVTVVKENLFLYTVEAEIENPFKAWREDYDNPSPGTFFRTFKSGRTSYWTPRSDQYQGGEAEIAQIAVANGWTEVSLPVSVPGADGVLQYQYSRLIMPAFTEAFPIAADLENFNPDIFEVNAIWVTGSRYDVSGPAVKERDLYGVYYYMFPAKFDTESETIRFRYLRPNATGWYITAILLGAAATGIVLLIVHLNKKKKPLSDAPKKGFDTFGKKPLNPFGDGYDQKQIGKNKNDPFDGY